MKGWSFWIYSLISSFKNVILAVTAIDAKKLRNHEMKILRRHGMGVGVFDKILILYKFYTLHFSCNPYKIFNIKQK